MAFGPDLSVLISKGEKTVLTSFDCALFLSRSSLEKTTLKTKTNFSNADNL